MWQVNHGGICAPLVAAESSPRNLATPVASCAIAAAPFNLPGLRLRVFFTALLSPSSLAGLVCRLTVFFAGDAGVTSETIACGMGQGWHWMHRLELQGLLSWVAMCQ